MQVLRAMERASGALRDLIGYAGVSVRNYEDPIVIVSQDTMQAMMYASRETYQNNYVLKDDGKRAAFGIVFGGVTYMTKEDYNARYQQ